MSNETDLDWLARNVHVWPTNTPKAILPGDATFKLGAVFYGDCVAFSGELGPEYRRVNKADWLARRAELQNKPSWETHEYKVIAQGRNGSWYGSNYSEEKFGHESSFCITGTGWNCICRGVDLGDWRDTLENRPEEFKLFTSIEDNHEQEMKRDNGWLERGELPPVGAECDIRHSCWNSEKYEKVTVAAITNEYTIVKYATFEQHYMLKDISFRPIRTDRDVLISVIIDEMNRYDTDAKLADAILEAGFKLEAK